MDIDWDKIRVTSHAAMTIVGLDRLRFNEAVNAGSYPCAPQGQRGKTRMFEGEEQLICLYLFARLLDDGVKHEKAGQTACRLLNFFAGCRDVGEPFKGNTIVRVKGQAVDHSIFVDGDKFDPDINRKGHHFTGIGLNLISQTFDIGNMRGIIRQKFNAMLDEQRHTLTLGGAEEDEE